MESILIKRRAIRKADTHAPFKVLVISTIYLSSKWQCDIAPWCSSSATKSHPSPQGASGKEMSLSLIKMLHMAKQSGLCSFYRGFPSKPKGKNSSLMLFCCYFGSSLLYFAVPYLSIRRPAFLSSWVMSKIISLAGSYKLQLHVRIVKTDYCYK